MHVPAMAELAFIVALLILASSSGTRAWVCEPSCGGIALNYPFGSTWGCGHANFQSYINCSHGKLNFYTPTGIYKVQSIDYSRNVIVIVDPHMSTCSSMQLSGAFGLPVGAPFTFASYNNIVLIGCSSTSSLFSKQSCDSSAEAQDICSSLYQNCDAIGQIGIIASNNGYGGQGSQSSCCVYSSSLLQTAPYEVDLPLLQCSTYTSIYGIGSIQSPQTSWLYGIALQYDPSFSSPQSIPYGQYPSCYVCQRAEESRSQPLRASPWISLGLLLLLVTVMTSLARDGS